jgi:Transglycosylase-like domain
MQKIAIAGLVMSAILLVPTSAAQAKTKRTSCNNAKLVTAYSANYIAVAKLHGKRAPGRNIRKWGLSERHMSTCRHIAKSLRTLRGMRFSGSQMLRASRPHIPPAQTSTLRAVGGGTLSAIRGCESGGNYSTNTGNGFYGAYQFTQSTWNSVGGSGNPAAASPAEQDKRAAMLYAREGASPWPVCGR